MRPADLRSLKAFGEDYPEATRRLLYRGEERLGIDGVLCQPVEEFLRGLFPGGRLELAKDPLRVHPELSRIEFPADPAAPLDPEDWPGAKLGA